MQVRRTNRLVVVVGVLGGIVALLTGTSPLYLAAALLLFASVVTELVAGWRSFTGWILIPAGVVYAVIALRWMSMGRALEAAGGIASPNSGPQVVIYLLLALYGVGVGVAMLLAHRRVGTATDSGD